MEREDVGVGVGGGDLGWPEMAFRYGGEMSWIWRGTMGSAGISLWLDVRVNECLCACACACVRKRKRLGEREVEVRLFCFGGSCCNWKIVKLWEGFDCIIIIILSLISYHVLLSHRLCFTLNCFFFFSFFKGTRLIFRLLGKWDSSHLILLFNLFLLLFNLILLLCIGFIELFDIIYGFYYTILTNFYLYLQYF